MVTAIAAHSTCQAAPHQTDELFSETEYLGPSALDFCDSQPLAFKYIWDITFEEQIYQLFKFVTLAHCAAPRLLFCPSPTRLALRAVLNMSLTCVIGC